jgi:hypothetical protein
MVIFTLDKRPGVVGLHVGTENVQQFFSPDTLLVELELDHLSIVCTLDPSFWQDRPVIHDLRLSSWLDAKRTGGKLASPSGRLALIPSGPNAFRLQPLEGTQGDGAPKNHEGDEAQNKPSVGLAVMGSPLDSTSDADPGAPVPTPVVSVITDRRRRNRIGKLKSDDPPSSSAAD